MPAKKIPVGEQDFFFFCCLEKQHQIVTYSNLWGFKIHALFIGQSFSICLDIYVDCV